MERYIGMDVHVASCTLAVISEKGRKLRDFPVEANGQALVEAVQMLVPGNHPHRLDQRLAVGLDREIPKLPALLGNHRQRAARGVYVLPMYRSIGASSRWGLLIPQLEEFRRAGRHHPVCPRGLTSLVAHVVPYDAYPPA